MELCTSLNFNAVGPGRAIAAPQTQSLPRWASPEGQQYMRRPTTIRDEYGTRDCGFLGSACILVELAARESCDGHGSPKSRGFRIGKIPKFAGKWGALHVALQH